MVGKKRVQIIDEWAVLLISSETRGCQRNVVKVYRLRRLPK